MKDSASSPSQNRNAAPCASPLSARRRSRLRGCWAASLAMLAAWALCSGCAMCQSPWDYCNAVIGPCGYPNCCFGARCGSAFAPIGHTPATTQLGPTPAGGGTESSTERATPAPYMEDAEGDRLDSMPDSEMPGF